MGQLGPKEVRVFENFLNPYDSVWSANTGQSLRRSRYSPEQGFYNICLIAFQRIPINEVERHSINGWLSQRIPSWPIKNFSWMIPSDSHASTSTQGFTLSWYVDNLLELSILERAGLLRRLTAEKTVKTDHFARVEAFALTSLGLEFYSACTGKWTQ